MLEKLKLVEARYLEMAERAAQPDFYNDPRRSFWFPPASSAWRQTIRRSDLAMSSVTLRARSSPNTPA